MKMYTFASSPNCWKVLAVARELSLSVEPIQVDLFKGEAKTPAFLTKNPNGRVPVLEEDGFVLWESNAILAYLATRQPIPSLLPVKPRERAEVDRWLYWESTNLSPAVWKVGFEKIVKPIAKQAPDAALIASGTAEFAAAARVLDEALTGKDFVASKLSIADFAIAPFIGLATGACELEISQYRNLAAWMDRMNARESVRQTMAAARTAMGAQGASR
jgi:glutathione S-transferase